MARAADELDPDELEQIAEPRYHQRTIVGISTDMQLRIHCICHKISGAAADVLRASAYRDPSHSSRRSVGFLLKAVAAREAPEPACHAFGPESAVYPSEFRRLTGPAVPAL